MPFLFSKREKSVAMFILTGIFFIIVMIILIAKGSDLIVRKTYYWTTFSDTHNFTGGTDIRYKGITVGKIRKMTLTEDNRIRAEFYLYRAFNRLLDRESVLRVQSSLLGASNLVLVTFPKEEHEPVEPESMIYSSDTPEGVEILRKHRMVAESADELSDKLKIILDDVHTLRPILTDTLDNISSTMANINLIVAGLQGKGKTAMSEKILVSLDNIRRLTQNIEQTSENLNSKENSVGKLIQDEGELIAKIDALAENLKQSSEDIKKISSTTAARTDQLERIVELTEENLVEMKKVMKGLQKVLGTNSNKP